MTNAERIGEKVLEIISLAISESKLTEDEKKRAKNIELLEGIESEPVEEPTVELGSIHTAELVDVQGTDKFPKVIYETVDTETPVTLYNNFYNGTGTLTNGQVYRFKKSYGVEIDKAKSLKYTGGYYKVQVSKDKRYPDNCEVIEKISNYRPDDEVPF